MSVKIPGTNVAATITPFTTADEIATHDALYGKGGYRTVSTIEERNNIKKSRKTVGMLVYVLEDGKIYQLFKMDPTTEEGEDWYWEEFTVGSSTPTPEINWYIHEQTIESYEWVIQHSLGRYPSVTVLINDPNNSGHLIQGMSDVEYIDLNNLKITFAKNYSGTAYLI